MPRNLEVHYTPVQIASYAPIFPEELMRSKIIVINDAAHVDIVLRSLDKVNKRSKFERGMSRLLIEATASTPEYLMDTEGNVRRGKSDYQITPSAFLYIVDTLNFYAAKSLEQSRK